MRQVIMSNPVGYEWWLWARTFAFSGVTQDEQFTVESEAVFPAGSIQGDPEHDELMLTLRNERHLLPCVPARFTSPQDTTLVEDVTGEERE